METPSDAPTAAEPVSADLVNHLHDATERLHQSKARLDDAIDAYEYRHQERVNDATDEFRRAEKEIEQVHEQIKDSLHEKPEA